MYILLQFKKKNILGLELVSALAWGSLGLGGSLRPFLLVAGVWLPVQLVAHPVGRKAGLGAGKENQLPLIPVIISLILQRPHVTSLLLLNSCQREGGDLRPCSSEAEVEARRDN